VGGGVREREERDANISEEKSLVKENLGDLGINGDICIRFV
jgi:hypothetical protein